MFRRLLSTPLILVLAVAVAAAGCGDSGDATRTETVERTVTTTVTTARGADEAPGDDVGARCSASGLDIDLPDQPDLPAPVADTREQLFDAAESCDFVRLGAIAARNTEGFGFTFGTEKDPVVYWRSVDDQQRTLERLARILTAPYVKTNQGGVAYAWPSVYTDAPTSADYAALVKSGAYTQREVDAFRQGGIYYGYRTSIAPNGTWQFFTVGD